MRPAAAEGIVTLPVDSFATLPDPLPATDLDDLVERLRLLKVWAGDPSYETIKDRVNAAWAAAARPATEFTRRSTVADCFRSGRRRVNTDLFIAVVHALHPDVGYVNQWRQALRVIGGETEAVTQVRVQDRLPQDLDEFTGRLSEIDQLRRAIRVGDAVVISAIEGMAGVGKTQLAVHAGHLLHQEEPFERVLFVNLRGFHPDPAQPPADPSAVLDGFLRLLGVPGQQIPHDLTGRTTAFRDRLAGTRALVVLDNAASADQVRPLLPARAGCLTLVTSRHSLTELDPAVQLTVDVFTPGEALAFLTAALPGVPVGPDPAAAARITRRCGYLPLALSLIAGHIRGTPGWTLTDHADRLDERHQGGRLESGVELALDLSYKNLPAGQQRLFRVAALHPGQDFDTYAAAALAGTDLDTARTSLDHLCRDHLLQRTNPGRYTFHDLARAYAAGRAHDQDPRSERRGALTRLFDHYLATTAAAMNTLHPAESRRRPQIPPAGTPGPDLSDPGTAATWLDTERSTLIAVAAYTATHGWPTHTTRLARTLYRYLDGGHYADALTAHGHAHQAACESGDVAAEAHALTDFAVAHLLLGRTEQGTDHLQRALTLFHQIGDPAGQARALGNLGLVAEWSGRYEAAIDFKQRALTLYQEAGDLAGEATTLIGLGTFLRVVGRLPEAIDHFQRSLALARETGDQRGEAAALHYLGAAETLSGRYEAAGDHLRQALTLCRQLRNRTGEAGTLGNLGVLLTHLGRLDEAVDHHQQALTILRETGDQYQETVVLNSLGETALAAGRPADALAHHTAACTIATGVGVRDEQVGRAHTGLGHAYRALGSPAEAREHYQRALTALADLGIPEAAEVRDHLAALPPEKEDD